MTASSNTAPQRKILVSIRRPGDVDLAKALVQSLHAWFDFFLLFAEEALLDRYGDPDQDHGLDPHACILNPHHFAAVISFSGPRTGAEGDLFLLSFFNQIGVATVELQHSLFQDGFYPLTQRRSGKMAARTRVDPALCTSFEAKTVLGWAGEDGIGYLKSDLVRREPSFVREGLILVTSGLDWDGYTDKERYQFAISVLKLAAAHPELHFVWRPRLEERLHLHAKHVLSLVDAHDLPNLTIDEEESCDSIMARCQAGIAMPSTALLDFAICNKPVAVYRCGATEGLLGQDEATSFRNFFELEALWTRLSAAPDAFRVSFDIGGINPDRLRKRLTAVTANVVLSSDWHAIAIKYLAYMGHGQTARKELSQLSTTLHQVNRRLASLEKRVEGVDRAISKIPPRLTKVLERVGVLQRSTLAYKALRLMSRTPKLTDSARDK